MALWQFSLHLIPKPKVLNVFKQIPTILPMDVFDSIEWWENLSLTDNHKSEITHILPKQISWSSNLELWGDADSNCIRISNYGGCIGSVFIRIDMREFDFNLLNKIVDLAKYFNCLILTEEQQLLEPSIEFFLPAIEKSKAYSFVQDPHKYFQKLK